MLDFLVGDLLPIIITSFGPCFNNNGELDFETKNTRQNIKVTANVYPEDKILEINFNYKIKLK